MLRPHGITKAGGVVHLKSPAFFCFFVEHDLDIITFIQCVNLKNVVKLKKMKLIHLYKKQVNI